MFSDVASPETGGGQKVWGAKMFDFRRITLFCLEKRLSKHKMTTFSKNLGSDSPFGLPLTMSMAIFLNHNRCSVKGRAP